MKKETINLTDIDGIYRTVSESILPDCEKQIFEALDELGADISMKKLAKKFVRMETFNSKFGEFVKSQFKTNALGLYFNLDDKPIVVYENYSLARYTIAHELGHHFCGHGKERGNLSHSWVEIEANLFAMVLLVLVDYAQYMSLKGARK